MGLGCNEPRVSRNFYHFYDTSIRRKATQFHTVFSKNVTVIIVHFVSVTMSFVDGFFSVNLISKGISIQNTWVRTET